MVVALLIDLLWYTGSTWLAYPIGTARDVAAEVSDPGVAPPALISPPDDVPPYTLQGRHKLYFKSWMTNLYNLAGYRSTGGYAALIPNGALPMQSETYKLLMGSKAIWREESGWSPVVDPLPTLRLLTDLVTSARPELDIS